MCAQCMVTATTAAGAATGLRSWLATRSCAWLTPTRMRRLTGALGVVTLVAAAKGSGGA